MPTIPLTKGYAAQVDDVDMPRLSPHRWRAKTGRGGKVYAVTTVAGRDVLMHRLLYPALVCDHINGDGLDNRRANLRAVPRNGLNVAAGRCRPSATGYRGVTKQGDGPRPFMARVNVGGKGSYVGRFATAEEAARARDRAALIAYGRYAVLNFPAGVRAGSEAAR